MPPYLSADSWQNEGCQRQGIRGWQKSDRDWTIYWKMGHGILKKLWCLGSSVTDCN
jgi:hypothetical protein